MSLRAIYLRKKFWIIDFFNGAKMWRDFKEVSYIISHPDESVRLRRKKLADIIEFAKKNTAFYGKVNGNNLSDFPVISKSDVLNNPNAFFVDSKLIPGQEGPLHIQKTSGSTGTPFEIRQDTACRIRRIATIKAANELIGFHSFMSLMHLRAVKHYWGFKDDITYKKDLNIWYADNANLNEGKIRNIIDTINVNKIKFVRGYVTAIDTITNYAVEHNIELVSKPTFITGGELLLENVRKRIVDDLRCRVISQYANEESGVFGQSGINHIGTDMKLYLANCYIEVLKVDSDEPVGPEELGRIVVTDYTNRAMPLLRYEVGDLAMVGARTEDGEVTYLRNLVGRKTDMIIKTNGATVDFFNSISPEVYNNPSIRQWQFIQRDAKEYILRLSVRDLSIKNQECKLQQYVKDVVGKDAVVHVEFVDEIPVLSSGKRKVIIQEWKK